MIDLRMLAPRARALAMAFAAALVLSVPTLASAQTTTGTTEGGTASNPVGVGSAWSSQVTGAGSVDGVALDPGQLAIVEKINDYFNALGDLHGSFVQTDAANEQQRGRFYIRRPGRFRFVYAAPSKMVIIADGENLSFEDHDIKSADRYPLDSTPFRVLLEPQVDLVRDALIADVYEGPDLIVATLKDKADPTSGQIKVFLSKAGDQVDLKEWIITGPQGGDTRVELADLDHEPLTDASLFQPTPFIPVSNKRK